MMETREVTKRRKHIDLRNMYIKDIVEKFDLILAHVPAGDQKADFFPDPLRRVAFERQRSFLGEPKLYPLDPGACDTKKRLPGQ